MANWDGVALRYGVVSMRLVVFDWDQTLWDSWDLHRESIWHIADLLGVARPPLDVVIAHTYTVVEGHIRALYGRAEPELMERYLRFYREHQFDLARPFPGAQALLEALKAAGLRLALLSNKRRMNGHLEVEASGLAPYLDLAVFREDQPQVKPAPDGLVDILERLGAAPEEACFVGDAPTDMACARAARVLGVGALWGALDRGLLLASGPDLLWETMEEGRAHLEARVAARRNGHGPVNGHRE